MKGIRIFFWFFLGFWGDFGWEEVSSHAHTPLRSELPSFKAYRDFDMDLTSDGYRYRRMWEWVGPKSGILVYWDQSAPSSDSYPITLNGSHLFGNHTFGRTGDESWEHGYQPLALLDQNGDGFLTAQELERVWIWVDSNSNARVDEGEMKPASHYVRWLSVQAEVDDSNNAEAPVGAELLDGTKVGSWDWWSRKWELSLRYDRIGWGDHGMEIKDRSMHNKHGDALESHPSHVYFWTIPNAADVGSGFLRFIPVGDEMYVIATGDEPRMNRPFSRRMNSPYYRFHIAKLKRGSDSILYWTFDLAYKKWIDASKVEIVGDGSLLMGDSVKDLGDGNRGFYSWVADPMSSENMNENLSHLLFSLTSFSDEAFADWLREYPYSMSIFLPVLDSEKSFVVSPFKGIPDFSKLK